MTDHIVEKGECLISISEKYGFLWSTLWNHDRNSDLREKRKDPNTLVPGDVVYIPEKRTGIEKCSTDQEHVFRKKGTRALFRLQVFEFEEPRAFQTYELVIDGVKHIGRTSGEGILQLSIPPSAQKAELMIGPDHARFELFLGHLHPVTEISGVKSRLSNLGFDCGEPEGGFNDQTEEALLSFQRRFGLPETGQADDLTRKELEELHDTVIGFLGR